jgi:hypothetical protein
MAKSSLQVEQQIAQLRALWCEWDPIGVLDDPDWPRDEYDDYLRPTRQLLESGAGVGAIAQYLNNVVGESLALGETGVMSAQPIIFAAKLRDWFDTHWAAAASAPKRKRG